MNTRLENLIKLLPEHGLDALLVSQPENRRYLSGFTGSAGVLIITPQRALLATDFRYYQQVKAQAPDFELVQVPQATHTALAEAIAGLGARRLGFESQDLTVATFEQWKSAMPDAEWVPTSGLVERLRVIKDASEVAVMREAIRIADEAMIHIMGWIHPGVTEREIAWELEVHMRTRGAEALSFTTIVASGPNGDMPHAITTERAVQPGDGITIDMGARFKGYCSDLTRSFVVGQPSAKYRHVWETVLQGQLAAEQAIRAGLAGLEADAVARKIIYAAGYEGMFGHGLGHGVGLAIHEGPRASMSSTDTLQTGTIVTVEPGVYIPGWGGVRIEDMVLVTDQGCEVLTQAPKIMAI
jgi:Xaa-Pro aminopeptidase